MSMTKKRNAFEQLLKDLNDGVLGYNQLHNAYRTHIRQSKVLPEDIKNLLSVAGGGGVVGDAFHLIAEIIGRIELAYRRGFSAGIEYQKGKDAKKEQKIHGR